MALHKLVSGYEALIARYLTSNFKYNIWDTESQISNFNNAIEKVIDPISGETVYKIKDYDAYNTLIIIDTNKQLMLIPAQYQNTKFLYFKCPTFSKTYNLFKPILNIENSDFAGMSEMQGIIFKYNMTNVTYTKLSSISNSI